MRVGFVGVGDIGAPMARRLALHHPTTVWSRRRSASDELVAAGARRADEIGALGECDVVGVCVSDDGAVRDVVDALAPSLAPTAVVCLHSTVHPDTATDAARLVAARGARLVDAPVSGGADGAAAGRLQIYAGGDPDDLDRCRDVLAVLGTVHPVGGIGDGQRTKLLNNAVYAAHLGLARDVMSTATELGLDPDRVVSAIGEGSGGSFALGRLRRLQTPGRAAHVVWLLGKDLHLAASLPAASLERIGSAGRDFLASLEALVAAHDRTAAGQIDPLAEVLTE